MTTNAWVPPRHWLACLDPDPVRAEEDYQTLKRDLTRFLEWQHDDPESAAQEALVRGLARIADGADVSGAGPRAFLFGVARNVAKEGWRIRKRERRLDPVVEERHPSTSREHQRADARLLLREVLRQLSARDRQLIIRYCTEDDHSAQCADLGVTPVNLRVMVHRIRTKIRAMAGLGPHARGD